MEDGARSCKFCFPCLYLICLIFLVLRLWQILRGHVASSCNKLIQDELAKFPSLSLSLAFSFAFASGWGLRTVLACWVLCILSHLWFDPSAASSALCKRSNNGNPLRSIRQSWLSCQLFHPPLPDMRHAESHSDLPCIARDSASWCPTWPHSQPQHHHNTWTPTTPRLHHQAGLTFARSPYLSDMWSSRLQLLSTVPWASWSIMKHPESWAISVRPRPFRWEAFVSFDVAVSCPDSSIWKGKWETWPKSHLQNYGYTWLYAIICIAMVHEMLYVSLCDNSRQLRSGARTLAGEKLTCRISSTYHISTLERPHIATPMAISTP